MTVTTQTYTNVALAADGLAAAVAYTAGITGYVLTAAGPADGLAHIITIAGKAATNHSAKTFTVTGTDENGVAVTQTIAGPNGVATVATTKYFATVTSITVSATTGADTFDLGWTAAAVGAWIYPHMDKNVPLILVGIGITATSSPTYAIRYTYDGVAWFTHATITEKSASFDGTITFPCAAFQLIFAAAGTVVMTVIQPGAY